MKALGSAISTERKERRKDGREEGRKEKGHEMFGATGH